MLKFWKTEANSNTGDAIVKISQNHNNVKMNDDIEAEFNHIVSRKVKRSTAFQR